MPYSTRRVSLNLQSLGVQLPQSRGSNRSPPNPSPTTAAPSSDNPPAKRIKRSHTIDSTSLPSAATSSRPRPHKSISSIPEKPVALAQFTPPPSPGNSTNSKKIDTQDIKDDIVVAVIRQLEATGNKPHQIKDLASILAGVLDVVASSQNPVAIISSRLTNYLKKPWTALAPCPLAKEQVTIHPRRVYYYLTSIPRQEIPEYSQNYKAARHIISPSISSGTDSDHNSVQLEREREALSPESQFNFSTSHLEDLGAHGIAEIHFADDDFDQSLPDMDMEEPAPVEIYSHQPPLEHDEREFSQMAGAMRQRKESEQAESRRASRPSSAGPDGDESNAQAGAQEFPEIVEEPASMEDDTNEDSFGNNQDQDANFLFGHQPMHAFQGFTASPMMKPQQEQNFGVLPSGIPTKKGHTPSASAPDALFAWSDLKSPENVGLAELDDLLEGC